MSTRKRGVGVFAFIVGGLGFIIVTFRLFIVRRPVMSVFIVKVQWLLYKLFKSSLNNIVIVASRRGWTSILLVASSRRFP